MKVEADENHAELSRITEDVREQAKKATTDVVRRSKDRGFARHSALGYVSGSSLQTLCDSMCGCQAQGCLDALRCPRATRDSKFNAFRRSSRI